MSVKNDDNEIVTKGYLRSELARFEDKLTNNLTKSLTMHFDQTFERCMGMYMEAMDDKIQLFMDGYADIPRQVMILRDRADKNDSDHQEFRLKL